MMMVIGSRKLMPPLKSEVIGDRLLRPKVKMRRKPLSPELLLLELRERLSHPLPFPLYIWSHPLTFPIPTLMSPPLHLWKRLLGISRRNKGSWAAVGKLSLDMKTGFDDIKELFAAHDERFNLLDKDVRLLKHQVNNSVRVATDVIQATVK
ncbi:hypothetical protein CJ030_MR5G009666 [Morella rubra]|uniref:Uncharacterized protein n=1 Tax=Morella rubra TaxID=262757 RepID=A0A6A1VK11_9ROSI|nr:hypothetical protein CJ030_MR5G009666 [Morella rubra]